MTIRPARHIGSSLAYMNCLAGCEFSVERVKIPFGGENLGTTAKNRTVFVPDWNLVVTL